MPSRHKIEFLLYTVCLLVLVTIAFVKEVDLTDDTAFVILLPGVLVYLLSAITIARAKWKYLGLISAFMVWTGSFCVVSSFLSFIDPEPSTYSRIFNSLYAFFGVFGGIRMYRAWLARNKAEQKEEA